MAGAGSGETAVCGHRPLEIGDGDADVIDLLEHVERVYGPMRCYRPAEVSRRSRRNALAVATLAALVVGAYVWVWLGVDRAHIGLSDFTATYVGATLLDQG